jgi:hypothetical protein
MSRCRTGDWQGWSPTWMLGHRIYGKRLGIIGMGRIGQAVARRAKAFGLQIHYHNRKRRVRPASIEEELEATYWESLDQMLARMDIVSVNCPHTPATYHLLSARRLKLLKPDAYIVNTARGEVIDENALARMIEAGEIAGAGLDVFEHEPAVNPKLLKLGARRKVVLLPHMGSATIEGRIDMGEKVIINIKTFIRRPPPAGVDGSFAGLAEQGFEFGEELLDRIEVGRIGRQVEQLCASGFDGLAHAWHLVGAEIVHHDDVAWRERRHEDLLDIGHKRIAVHRAVNDSGCGQRG